ncbi:MAG TPA: hypothetical protein VNT92_11045, partial [Acidimicrobiia bacterium]|nr:hypothetical protein [Acidimicrobiia bacterium]
TAAQAAALIDGLISDGNWREVHPTDRVELWLDGTALVPLAMDVYPADTADRRLWAVRHGYVDSPDTPFLEVSWTEVTVNDTRQIELPAPPAGADESSYGFRDGEVDGLSVMNPSNVPDGMTLHRTGIVDTGAGPSVSVATWSDGRAWLKVRWTDDWDGNRLFGDLGALVRQVPIGTGVGYLDERGEKVGIHGVDIDVALMGSLPTGDLVDLAASLDVVGVAIPDIWAESGTATAQTASDDVEGLLIPRGLEGFGAPTIRSDVGVVTLAYAGAGNRAFLLTESGDGRLSPPLEANVRAVDVRGVEGRYSPDRGLLEWVESGLTISITSTTMTVDELVAIAGMLQAP